MSVLRLPTIVALCCTGLVPLRAEAQDAPDSMRVLGPITVEGRRPPATPVGVRMLRLDRGALSSQGLLGAMERDAGLFVQRYGTGAPSVLRIHGTDDSHTAVLLDGVSLRDPHTGAVDLDLLPRVVLESVETGLGAAAGQHGSGLGGTVRIVTRPATGCGDWRLDLAGGAYGMRRGGGRVAGVLGASCVHVAADLGSERGDFPVPEVVGAPDRRIGAERSHDAQFVAVRGASGRWRWATTALRTASGAGMPGPANASPRGARMHGESWRATADVRRAGTHIVTGAAVLFHASSNRFDDPARGSTTVSKAATLRSEWHAGGALRTAWRADARIVLGLTQGVRPTSRRHVTSTVDIAFSGRAGPARTEFGLAAGRWPAAGSHVLPRASVVVPFGHAVAARASAGRAIRPPTIAELSWIPGGNPDLRAERGWSFDVGLLADAGGLEADVGFYLHHVRDRIVWQPRLVAPGLDVWSPANVGRTRGAGLEASMDWTMHAGSGAFRILAHGSVDHVIDRSDPRSASYGHPLRHVPAGLGTIGLSWTAAHGGAETTIRRVGRRPVASDGTRHAPAFTVLDLAVEARPFGRTPTLTVRLDLRNVLDARYAYVPQYPMPGRHVSVSLTLDLDKP